MTSVLYCQGTFDIANPNSQQIAAMKTAAQQIGAAGYSCVILGQWHVHADGTIYYNNTPIADVAPTLAWLPQTFKAAGVSTVLVSFGPFASDFSAILANLDSFKATMDQLLSSSALDGIDWDLEQELTASNAQALAGLVDWSTSGGYIVTADPYYAQSEFWNVAQQTAQKGFAWWNVQMYSSGYNADMYAQWVAGMGDLVPNPQSFIRPGYNVDASNGAPSDITSMLKLDGNNAPGLDGAMLWKYEFIVGAGSKGTLQGYAQAIAAGLPQQASAVKRAAR